MLGQESEEKKAGNPGVDEHIDITSAILQRLSSLEAKMEFLGQDSSEIKKMVRELTDIYRRELSKLDVRVSKLETAVTFARNGLIMVFAAAGSVFAFLQLVRFIK